MTAFAAALSFDLQSGRGVAGSTGGDLIASLIYKDEELCVPQRVTTRHVNRLFGLTQPRSSVGERKKVAGELSQETRQMLLQGHRRGSASARLT